LSLPSLATKKEVQDIFAESMPAAAEVLSGLFARGDGQGAV
jgi:hypothetical protein